jgi:hypothetical protein
VNRPGNCGDSFAWKGWSHGYNQGATPGPEALPAGDQGAGGPYGPPAPSGGSR